MKKKINLFILLAALLLLAGCEKEKLESNPEITAHIAVKFAVVLEEKGYIASAKKIKLSDVKNIKELYIASEALTTISGIEYFEALTQLDCSMNQLANIDISKNMALTYLDCSSNKLVNLDVSNNTELTRLECGVNQLINLDVSKNTKLTDFGCSVNQLTGLDVSNNPELAFLGCSSNKLTHLNVSNNMALRSLLCRTNQLVSIDISNTGLAYLDCSFNPGDGTKFVVIVDDEIPSIFGTGGWPMSNSYITIDFQSQKAEISE